MRTPQLLLVLLFLLAGLMPAQAQVDTLLCGDTLLASYNPLTGGSPSDSFFIWLGNCQPNVRFDLTTADVPDAADLYYVDVTGNQIFAGSLPYFGGNCNGPNYFTDPLQFPPASALDPNYCLRGFLELYGQGLPLEDSLRQRSTIPSDFFLPGTLFESARLHLDIPPGVVGVLFVVRYNPNQYTVLNALWDCTPTCCIEGIGDTVCVGESIQLDSDREAFGYQWTGPNGYFSTLKSPLIPQATPAHEGWYILEGHYLLGCVALDSVYVQVDGPAINISPAQSGICAGDSLSLQASGAQSYVWSLATPGLLSANGANAWVSPLDTTTYQVIGTDGSGCIDTAFATVWPQSMNITLQGQGPACFGGNDGSVQASMQDGTAPYQIRTSGMNWQNGSSLSGLAAGTYLIEIQDAAGCRASDTISLTDPAPLQASARTTDPLCDGSCDGSITVDSLSGTGPYQFSLNGSPADSVNLMLCAGTYALDVQDALGCSWSGSASLNDPAPLQANVLTTDPICAGSCDGSIAVDSLSGTGPYQFSLDGSPADSVNLMLCAGTYALTVQDALGCSWNGSASLSDPAALTATFSTQEPTCADACDGSVSISVSGNATGYSYSLNGSSVDSVATNLCAGTFQLEVQNSLGCSWQGGGELIDPPAIQGEVNTQDPGCANTCDGSISLSATGGIGTYTYWVDGNEVDPTESGFCAGTYQVQIRDAQACLWENEAELLSPLPLQTSTNISPISCFGECDGEMNWVASGGQAPYAYWLDGMSIGSSQAELCAGGYELTVLDANGCPWADTLHIEEPQVLAATLATQSIGCIGACEGEVQINATGGLAPYQYVVSGAPQSGSLATGFCAGSYEVLVLDANACTWEGNFALAEPAPLLATVGSSPPSCVETCDGELLILAFGGDGSYQYWVDGRAVDSVASGLCAGPHLVEIMDESGCSWSETVRIDEGPVFSLDLGRDQWVTEGRSLKLEAHTSASIAQIRWEGICESGCETKLDFSPQENRMIQATAWSAAGCEASDSLWVEVLKPLTCEESMYLPNAFSPNGDGINDQFTLYADLEKNKVSQISRFVIFNQWGKVVFDRANLLPNDASQGWDGFSKGEAVPEGTFSWAADILLRDGSSFDCSGSVVVLR